MTSNAVIHPSSSASIEETRLLLRPFPTEKPLRPECYGRSIARIVVGPPLQAQVFTIHPNLFTSANLRLAGMFERSSKAQEWTLICETIHPRAFEVFYQYLYTGQVYSLYSGSDFFRGLPVVSTIHSRLRTVGTSHGTSRLPEALRHIQPGFLQGTEYRSGS